MSQLLLTKINGVRRKRLAVATGSGIALAITAIVVLLAAEMFLDWIFDFPVAVRAAALLLDAGVIGYLLARYTFVPIIRGADDDELALMVEDQEPQFQHRLIASIQLSRPQAIPAGASASLVRAMIAQAESMARAIDFSRVVKLDQVMRFCITAALTVLIGGALFVYGNSPDHATGDLLARAFLSNVPVPRKTHVIIQDGDKKIAKGDNVDLSAYAQGICPSSGTLYIKSDSGREQEFPIDPVSKGSRDFTRQIQQVQESFVYSIKLNDGISKTYRVKVLERPDVADLKVKEVFPAYTHQQPADLEPGNLSVLVGSELQLKVIGNHPMSRTAVSYVHLVGPGDLGPSKSAEPEANSTAKLGDVTLTVDQSDPKILTAKFSVPPKVAGFSINLVDQDGLQNHNPVIFPIDLVPDKDPVVKITAPDSKEELETKEATLPVVFEAADDFGLTMATFKYKVDDGPVKEFQIPIANNPTSYRYQYIWDLSKVSVPPTTTRPSLEGSNIEFWVEVQDNNNVTGPGKGNSEHFMVKIVSKEAKEEELARKIAESLNGLENSQQVQEGVNQSTHTLLVPGQKPPEKP